MKGKVVAVCTSKKKGVRKEDIKKGILIEGFGLKGDAHGGDWHRQVSLLALESIQKMRDKGLDVHPGDFAENITTKGIDLPGLPIGKRIRIGERIILEVTQIGKKCHTGCAIFQQTGDCIMPKEGIFARVITGGDIEVGNEIVSVQK
ncbi:MAG: MOSC domain-containing protein [Thermodesulfobacteriota bacterium]|nr:MOSC domain-containing protein [Thermodesulfobacteriota bacterium]